MTIPGRAEHDVAHLDVLDRSPDDLVFLASLERHVSRLAPGGRTHPGCLVLAGTEANDHYTTVHVDGHGIKLRRLMLEAGGVDLSTVLGLHRCHHKPCARLAHLYAGSAAENAADALARDRHLSADATPGRGTPSATSRTCVSRTVAARGTWTRSGTASVGPRELCETRSAGAPISMQLSPRSSCRCADGSPTAACRWSERSSPSGSMSKPWQKSPGSAHATSGMSPWELLGRSPGGVRSARPGPARGRRVGTGQLTPVDDVHIAARIAAGQPIRAVAEAFGIDARTVVRTVVRARRRHTRKAGPGADCRAPRGFR